MSNNKALNVLLSQLENFVKDLYSAVSHSHNIFVNLCNDLSEIIKVFSKSAVIHGE